MPGFLNHAKNLQTQRRDTDSHRDSAQPSLKTMKTFKNHLLLFLKERVIVSFHYASNL